MGTTYQPLFPYFAHLKSRAALQNGHAAERAPAQPAGAFRVIADGYVKDDSGTGVVHQAPAFGEDDFRICIQNGGLLLPQQCCKCWIPLLNAFFTTLMGLRKLPYSSKSTCRCLAACQHPCRRGCK